MAEMDQLEALLKAAESGDVDFLSALLEKGLDVTSTDIHYDGVLLIAYRFGRRDFVYKLLEAGINLDSIVVQDLPRSHKWQSLCRVDILWFKVYRESFGLRAKHCKGFLQATFDNDYRMIGKCLQQIKSCRKSGARGGDKYSELFSVLLFLLVYKLDCPAEVFQMLIDKGADVNAIFHSFTICHFAVLCGNANGLNTLFKNGCLFDDNFEGFYSIFLHCIIFSKVDCLDLLLRNSDLSKSKIWRENGAELLTTAVRYGQDKCVELLLTHGASVERTDPKERDNFPLINACKGSNPRILELLLQHGADVNNSYGMGETALIHSAIFGFHSCMEKLILYRANLNAVDWENQTALMHAIQRKHKKCIRTLIDAGADTSIVNNCRETALIHAVSLHDAEILELILLSEQKSNRGLDGFHQDAFALALRQFDVHSLLMLLRFGIFSWEWLDTMRQSQIRTEILARVLVVSNIPPGHFQISNNIKGPKTLFQCALAFHDVWTAYYLMANLYLDEFDFKHLKGEKRFINRLHHQKNNSHALSLLRALISQPIPLQVLCILNLSTWIALRHKHGNVNRKEIIDSLPIPEKFKEILKFQGPNSNVCVDHWKSLGSQMSQRPTSSLISASLTSLGLNFCSCKEGNCGDNDRGFRLRYDLLQAINRH